MTHPLIIAALAMPKTHKCVTLFADGSEHVHETRNEASANTYANFVARPMIGRTLLSRETGLPCPVAIEVYVMEI